MYDLMTNDLDPGPMQYSSILPDALYFHAHMDIKIVKSEK